MQPDEDVVLTADLVNLAVGRFGEPVRRSGIFVGGAGDRGGRLNAQRLETKAIYVDGGIPLGTPNQITGGVFVVHGAYVGASGIGFVNFGTVRDLRTEAPIETFGIGARGFNVYAGTVERADFDRIVTHGDGAVGVQISQPIETLTVRRGVESFGGTGPSLVKGVVQNLPAVGLSSVEQGNLRITLRMYNHGLSHALPSGRGRYP
jgi:hypothetical protein